ncbi:DUF1579 domain-containing protein [Rhizobium glycinendophyticum]|uniref:DUF1579 domain-containing protein n=1 Tax=Rhizobium glycinendophyticum TaxID=2589807 RepID=A0A504UMJ4_9HYPH|nr:DUF1579 domain-containing protein [Rhizobium glycinendophyticum]TPP10306.1 DUF1579 domain-containing protein [Rhizobium glycinendophyticum]
MEFAKPTEHHKMLERLVGDWLYVTSTGMEGYDPEDPMKRWTEKVRSIGGFWVVAEGEGAMGDGDARGTMIITLGYDPRKGQYVGSWIGSMMDTFWVYKGWLEDDGQTLVLEAEGPSMEDPSRTELYRDVIHFIDDDTRTFSGSVRQPDGTFKTFMTSEAKRVG